MAVRAEQTSLIGSEYIAAFSVSDLAAVRTAINVSACVRIFPDDMCNWMDHANNALCDVSESSCNSGKQCGLNQIRSRAAFSFAPPPRRFA